MVSSFKIVAALMILAASISIATVEAFDALDDDGNITISWILSDIRANSYSALISISNFHLYRPIEGWSLGWSWDSREVVWEIVGGHISEGGCSNFKLHKPVSCVRRPTVLDLAYGEAHNQNIANCCKGGLLGPILQDSQPQTASFRIKVGLPPFKGIRPPRDFSFIAPGAGYTCGPATATQMSTKNWIVKCNARLNYDSPTCSVRMSSFQHNVVVQPPACRRYGAPAACTMLVQWHVVSNSLENWKVKVTITNSDNRKEWRNWNVLIKHPLANDVIPRKLKMSVYPGAIVVWAEAVIHTKSSIEFSLLFRHGISKPRDKTWAFPVLLAFSGVTCNLPSDVKILTLTPVVTSSPSLWKKILFSLFMFATSCAAFSCALKCVDFRRLSFRMAFRGPVKF